MFLNWLSFIFFDKKVNPFLFSFRVCSTPLARSVMCIGRFTTPCTSARRTPWSPDTREWPTMLRTTTRDISWTTFSRHWQSSVFVWFCVNTKSSVSKENSSWKDKYSRNPNYGLVQYSDHSHVYKCLDGCKQAMISLQGMLEKISWRQSN